jgi:hypothetical protein
MLTAMHVDEPPELHKRHLKVAHLCNSCLWCSTGNRGCKIHVDMSATTTVAFRTKREHPH